MAKAKASKTGPVEKKLIGVADVVITAAEKSKDPTLAIPVRSLANVNFNAKRGIIELGKRKQARTFFNVAMAKKFMQTVLVASKCKTLIEQAKTASIRQIFYLCKHTIAGTKENTFDDQDECDPIIEDMEVALNSLREELHLYAQTKGTMVGDISVLDRGFAYPAADFRKA